MLTMVRHEASGALRVRIDTADILRIGAEIRLASHYGLSKGG